MANYNGWTNYETWATALWLDNDEATQRECRRIVRLGTTLYETSDALREMVMADAPDLQNSVFSDLLNAALSEINWLEITKSFSEEEEEEDANDRP